MNNEIASSQYTLQGFHAPLTRHRDRHGGGVAIYVHKSIPFQRVHQLELGDEEWVWAKIKLRDTSLLICCVYLPPNSTAERLQVFIDNLTESASQATIQNSTATLILGDFNTGNIYLDQQYDRHSGITHFDHTLKDVAEMLNLQQIICQPTRITSNCENLRDLIVTTNCSKVIDSGTLSSFSNLDHLPVYVQIDATLPTKHAEPTHAIMWDYSKLNAPLLTRLLLDTDWTDILNNDIDIATDLFISAIHQAAIASIPTKRKTIYPQQKPWITSELKRNIRKRDRLFKIAKQTQNTFNWDRWKYQRNLVTSMNRRLKEEYVKNQVQKLLSQKLNPYKYHQTLRTITGQTRDDHIPPLQTDNGDIINDDVEKASLLNNYFAAQSTLNIPDTQEPPLHNMPEAPSLESITTTEQEVLRMLNSLDSNKSTGPDEIPVKLLKLIALLIAKPLSQLFNKSLTEGRFPSKFKEANVKPVFKSKGSPSDPTCYRPISILSAVSKVFEKIVYRKVYDHFTEHSLLSDKQSGYRQHHSTQQQLLYLTHNLYKSLDLGHDFTAIYLDISKYFDKIWHKGLLYKCKYEFGITGRLLDWFRSYLKDRQQRVKIRDTYSTTQTINAGCPQGSVLGPLLALIYLNGLSNRTQHDILFFADDTSIYASYTKTDLLTTQLSLQKDLDEIYAYGREWAITFNTTKTIQQTFSHKLQYQTPALTFGSDPIPVHDSHTHLGMTFSKDLRFQQHVKIICRKINIALSPLYAIAKYIPRPMLDQVYKTYIRPHFDYCDAIYDGHITVQDLMKLEKLQNRAARLVTGGLFRTSTDKLLTELGWDRLTTRRRLHRLTLYHKLNTAEQLPHYITSIIPNTRAQDTHRQLRNADRQSITTSNTSSYKRSFFPTTIGQWNELTQDTQQLTHTAFKKEICQQQGAPDPPAYYTAGTKKGNTLHARLRMEMSYLNSHSFKIKKADSPECRCGFHNETVSHFIFTCPYYSDQRNVMFDRLSHTLSIDLRSKNQKHQLNTLLHGTDISDGDGLAVALNLQDFLLSSKRFSHL